MKEMLTTYVCENLALQVTSWGIFKFHESTKDISTLKSHKIVQTSRK